MLCPVLFNWPLLDPQLRPPVADHGTCLAVHQGDLRHPAVPGDVWCMNTRHPIGKTYIVSMRFGFLHYYYLLSGLQIKCLWQMKDSESTTKVIDFLQFQHEDFRDSEKIKCVGHGLTERTQQAIHRRSCNLFEKLGNKGCDVLEELDSKLKHLGSQNSLTLLWLFHNPSAETCQSIKSTKW